MPSKVRQILMSLFVPVILLAITACPGFVIDNIVVSFDGGIAVVGATGTFTCISPLTGDVIEYQWSFGDGSTASGKTVTHTYSTSGEFLVECRVLTSNSAITFTKIINVSAGLQIVYACQEGSEFDICVAPADGSEPRVNLSVAVGNNIDDDVAPQWSPDGTRIAYQCEVAFLDDDICILNSDGTGTKFNLSAALGQSVGIGHIVPQWSPDGTQIAYNCGGTPSEICVAEADGSSFINHSTTLGVTGASNQVQWSPDGTQLVYHCNRPQDDVCIANADGTGVELNLSTAVGASGFDERPQWSPDGTQIAFRCTEAGPNICIANADGSGSIFDLSDAVGGDTGNDRQPQWSPDGTKIVYLCVDGDDDICVVNADGTGSRLNLSNTVGGDTGDDSLPQWSPDGLQIAYVCEGVANGPDICIVNADGSGSRFNFSDAVGDLGFDDGPQWSPF